MSMPGSRITITPSALLRAMVWMIVFLAAAHLAGLTSKQLGHERVFDLVRLFDMDRERNIPTLFSTCLFLLNGLVCLAIWKVRSREGLPAATWLVLAGTLFFLGADEFCQIHEYVNERLQTIFHTSGFFGPVWIIPYGIAAVILFTMLVPFFLRLEPGTRKLMALAAAVFLSGAVGIEMITGKYIALAEARRGDAFNMMVDLGYGLFVVVEESLEMLGLVVLSYALLGLLQKAHGGFGVVVPPLDQPATLQE